MFCNYDTAQAYCGLLSHNHSFSATTNQALAFWVQPQEKGQQFCPLLQILTTSFKRLKANSRHNNIILFGLNVKRLKGILELKIIIFFKLCTYGIRLSFPSVLTPSLFWTQLAGIVPSWPAAFLALYQFGSLNQKLNYMCNRSFELNEYIEFFKFQKCKL